MVVHKAPHECARRILLCVSGRTPQIVTETLQALLDQSPRFEPTAIHIITTLDGRDRAQSQLLATGRLAALCNQYGLEPLPIGFTVIGEASGTPLSDIRDDADNTAAADCILDTVRRLTQDIDCAIHASLAGGRKTMSHYMGNALSLFGRSQDRLSHVLVAPEWVERVADFYFRPSRPVDLQDRKDNVVVSSADVVITIADIPLLRLRDSLSRTLINGDKSFIETVQLANCALGHMTLTLDLHRRLAECSGISIKLSPANFAFLAWLAIRAQKGQEGIAINKWSDAEVEQYLKVYADVVGYDNPDCAKIGYESYERTKSRLQKYNSVDRKKYLTSRRGKLVDALECKLGKPLATKFLPPESKRGEASYELRLVPEAIEIHGFKRTG